MFDWILANEYRDAVVPLNERMVTVHGVGESQLLGVMEAICVCYPEVKLFSLPHLRPHPFIELGVRGRLGVDEAFMGLKQELQRAGVVFEE